MKKTIGIIVMLIATLIILTGCSVNVDYEVKINPNGSGEISYIYGYSKDTLDSLQTTSEQLVKSQKEQAEKNGYKTEEYKDDKIEGFKATKHINDISNVFTEEEFGKEYINKDTSKITIKKSLFKTQIEQKAEVDLTELNDVQSAVDIKYTVKTPVPIKTNNATEATKDGKTATWQLKPGEINNIEFSASGTNVSSIICVLLLTLLVVAGIVYFVMLFKKKIGTKE